MTFFLMEDNLNFVQGNIRKTTKMKKMPLPTKPNSLSLYFNQTNIKEFKI